MLDFWGVSCANGLELIRIQNILLGDIMTVWEKCSWGRLMPVVAINTCSTNFFEEVMSCRSRHVLETGLTEILDYNKYYYHYYYYVACKMSLGGQFRPSFCKELEKSFHLYSTNFSLSLLKHSSRTFNICCYRKFDDWQTDLFNHCLRVCQTLLIVLCSAERKYKE